MLAFFFLSFLIQQQYTHNSINNSEANYSQSQISYILSRFSIALHFIWNSAPTWWLSANLYNKTWTDILLLCIFPAVSVLSCLYTPEHTATRSRNSLITTSSYTVLLTHYSTQVPCTHRRFSVQLGTTSVHSTPNISIGLFSHSNLTQSTT